MSLRKRRSGGTLDDLKLRPSVANLIRRVFITWRGYSIQLPHNLANQSKGEMRMPLLRHL